jgi:two-component system, cell cycle sensor histidine kinase and response regulator CckA
LNGYQSTPASSGRAALAICEAAKDERLDLMITDVQMPGMNGRDLAKCLAKTSPHIPIVFMTGYSIDTEYQDALSREPMLDGYRLIKKPFRPAELMALVKNLMNKSDEAGKQDAV